MLSVSEAFPGSPSVSTEPLAPGPGNKDWQAWFRVQLVPGNRVSTGKALGRSSGSGFLFWGVKPSASWLYFFTWDAQIGKWRNWKGPEHLDFCICGHATYFCGPMQVLDIIDRSVNSPPKQFSNHSVATSFRNGLNSVFIGSHLSFNWCMSSWLGEAGAATPANQKYMRRTCWMKSS